MESNSDFNEKLARYTLCFNNQCPRAENCLRHSLTQYNTKLPFIRHQSSLLSRRRKIVPVLQYQ
nr:DUF6078 family protein [uncultured Bacteroides sp.]